MKILIEGKNYLGTPEISKYLDGLIYSCGVESLKIDSVGYYYNRELDDVVMVLPKVVLGSKVISDNITLLKNGDIKLDAETRSGLDAETETWRILGDFPVLICNALLKYKHEVPNTDIISGGDLQEKSDLGKDEEKHSLYEIVHALVEFYRENEDYVMFVVKNMNSGGSRINWNRTVVCTQPIIQKGRPIYMNPIYKKKVVDFDEELMVIFFSILEYIRSNGWFQEVPEICLNYDLIEGNEFENYRKGYGRRRLNEIRYKYYSDKAVEMWELCMCFFKWTDRMNSNLEANDCLLANKFEHVFEAMVDDLIGDKELKDTVNKEFKDKKEIEIYNGKVDHIYKDTLLGSNTYFIGDSKYYQIVDKEDENSKNGGEIKGKSVYKQFEYARNVQSLRMMNLWEDNEVQIYDITTGGYNVIPNFFIRGSWIDKPEERLFKPYSETDKDNEVWRFENWLFDRDTLSIYTFEVDFMQVLKLYVNGNDGERRLWRKEARSKIKKEVRSKLGEKYDFYQSNNNCKDDVVKKWFDENWRNWLGRIYKGENGYILAIKKDEKVLKEELPDYFNEIKIEEL